MVQVFDGFVILSLLERLFLVILEIMAEISQFSSTYTGW
jgi:hypothetical protein